jgi:lipopolysaccharide export system permease protein
MKILQRYILREHIGPFLAALGVLTGLMLLNQLAKRFGDLVGKGLPWYVIAEVFGLSVPFIVAMTMPMAVLVAVLYAFSQLSSDNEITAIKAGGVSLLRFVFPILIFAAAIATGMVWFNDAILPESNHALRQLLTDIGRKQPTFELRERVVNEVVQGKLFLQGARIDRARSVLQDMVIFDLGRNDVQRTIYADSGHMAFNETQTDLYLTLYDGSMHELDLSNPRMDQRSYYAKQVIRVPGVSNELQRGGSASWRDDRSMNISMMQEEVVRRRVRLLELQDSVARIMALLSPIRAQHTPPSLRKNDTPDEIDHVRGAASADHERPPQDERAQARRRPEALRAPDRSPGEQSSARARAAAERRARSLAQLRSTSRREQWPPGRPAAGFATFVRSELQRAASRTNLQRREINRYSVEIHKKFAIPIAAIVFVIIGAPIGVRFPRGGIGMVIGVSLTVFCVYYVCLIGGEDIADRGYISPFWSMWAPNVIFTAIGVIILHWVGRGGTRRRYRRLRKLARLLGLSGRADETEPRLRRSTA